MRVCDFDVVAKHLVEPDFERRDARALGLFLLHIGHPLLARGGYLTELVKLVTVAIADESAFAYFCRRVIHKRLLDAVDHVGAERQGVV